MDICPVVQVHATLPGRSSSWPRKPVFQTGERGFESHTSYSKPVDPMVGGLLAFLRKLV